MEEAELMQRLVAVANARHDGHLAILKFTTNWRVGFGTPDGREAVASMASGTTFAEAAKAALTQV